MEQPVAAFLGSVPIGVLGTQRPDGTVRQSAVYFAAEGDTVYVSTERARAKARDVGRCGRASLCVLGPSPPYPSVTLEGTARILETDIAPVTARIFARMTGGDPPKITDRDLAAMNRVLLQIDVEHVYGASYLPEPSEQPDGS